MEFNCNICLKGIINMDILLDKMMYIVKDIYDMINSCKVDDTNCKKLGDISNI